MQLSHLLAAATLALAFGSGPAAADGELTLRGAYYKERSTRVVQPMLDGTFQVGDHGTASGHVLVDAITSASASSGAADTAFTESRYEAGAGYAHELSWGALRGDARISEEPDYSSLYAGLAAEVALAEDNTVLGLGGGAGTDKVTNAGAQGPFSQLIEGTLRTLLSSASVAQVLSPNALISAGYDLVHLRGFQQNPYRTVLADGQLIAERHPETRTRHALAASGKLYSPALATTLIATYRFYTDSWGVLAHTPEARLIKVVGSEEIEASLRYRFHWQRRADFIKRSYQPTDDYFSDDEKLVSFTSHTLEAKLAVLGEVLGLDGRLGQSRGELLLQYVDQNNRFGNAISAQVALTIPFTY